MVGLPEPVTQIDSYGSHTCALAKGAAYCWGQNLYGALGNKTRKRSSVPVPVSGLGPKSKVSQISAGDMYTCAVVDGGAQCWGWNRSCGLGIKNCRGGQASEKDKVLSPHWVEGLPAGSGVTAIAAGDSHTCAVVKEGLKCWGWGLYGKVGDGNGDDHYVPTPSDVHGMGPGSGVTAVSLGSRTTCAIVHGSVKCWGKGILIGVGDSHNDYENPQMILGRNYNVQSLKSNNTNTCALDGKNRVWCWGLNFQGQVGNGKHGVDKTALTPQKVAGLASGEHLDSLAVGYSHSCVASGDSYQCWGSNAMCKLGIQDCEKWPLVDVATEVIPYND